MKRAILTFAALPPLLVGLFLLFTCAYLGFETLEDLQTEIQRPGMLLLLFATLGLYLCMAFFALRACATLRRTRSSRWLALVCSVVVIAVGALIAHESDVFLWQDLLHAHVTPDSPPAFFLAFAFLGLLGLPASATLLSSPAFSIPSTQDSKIAQSQR